MKWLYHKNAKSFIEISVKMYHFKKIENLILMPQSLCDCVYPTVELLCDSCQHLQSVIC